MSVIGGILLFAAGLVTGAGTLTLHNREVQRAVRVVEARKNSEIAKLRSAYTQLQEDADIRERAGDCADAFRRGKREGRSRPPLSDAEQFARTFEGRRVRFVDNGKKEG